MKTLYIDCAMGCAGDMLTAALLELHPDREGFIRRMNAVLNGKAVVSAVADKKCGIVGTHVSVLINGEEEGEHEHHHHEHDHEHKHTHHHHTGIQEIRAFIDAVDLPEKVKADAKAVYDIIAQAESTAHGAEIENIHFHEVGSLDAVADVLCVCELLYEITPEKVMASPVNVGYGHVKCAHGIVPVPAPATELILRGVPMYSGRVESELCTPHRGSAVEVLCIRVWNHAGFESEQSGLRNGKKEF